MIYNRLMYDFPIRQWLDYNPKQSVKKYDDPLVYFTTALDNVYMENKPDIHHIL